MCLAVPGKIVKWLDRDPTFSRAVVEFDGVRRVCSMACVADVEEGDYVIVHAGLAISRIDTHEAGRLLDDLSRLNALDGELSGEPSPEEPNP